MNLLDRVTLRAGLLLGSLSTGALPVLAKLDDPENPGGKLSNETDLVAVIMSILAWVLDIIAIIAVVFIVVAGIRLILSQGEEGEKDKAKKSIIYVIVGLIVILLARAIVIFVNDKIGT